jgi:hypothetical protein
VVIDNLYLVSVPFPPFKANTPLIVDTNRVLPVAVICQRLKAIGGRNSQIRKAERTIDHLELALRRAFDIDETPNAIPAGKLLCVTTPERRDR